jgi:translation initiation factor IF-1
MNRKHKRLIVVGDRVLVKTEEGDQRRLTQHRKAD